MSGIILLIIRVLLAAVLYSFLGWALYTIWRDLKRQSDILTTRQAPPISLVLGESGRQLQFTRPVIRLGRDIACDFSLDEPTVSTQHARLSFHHNQWWLEDLGSTNGTFLNEEPVTTPVVVTQGDQIRCGQVTMKIQIDQ
jgi:hypothetical protein